MTPTLSFKRGDTWAPVFQFRDGSGDPVDLSGCSVRFQARLTAQSPAVFTLSTDSATIDVDGPAGDVTPRLPTAVSAGIEPGKYKADLEVTYTDGTRQSTDTFTFTVVEDITHDG